jgi:hypothetical protein
MTRVRWLASLVLGSNRRGVDNKSKVLNRLMQTTGINIREKTEGELNKGIANWCNRKRLAKKARAGHGL